MHRLVFRFQSVVEEKSHLYKWPYHTDITGTICKITDLFAYQIKSGSEVHV